MTNISGAGLKERLQFDYDWQGRRIRKQVWTNWDATTPAPVLSERYIYDGWNLIAILDGTANTVKKSFVWGTDLSGSQQGAGGVGGLLMANLGTSTNFVCHDGNGNVTTLIDAATTNVNAQYEYAPFGEVIRATGPQATNNPFLFSTKFYDWETELNYFGYRYYNSIPGRFINRDPIEEQGGLNLYGFVGNNPIGYVDTDGRCAIPIEVGAVIVGAVIIAGGIDAWLNSPAGQRWMQNMGLSLQQAWDILTKLLPTQIPLPNPVPIAPRPPTRVDPGQTAEPTPSPIPLPIFPFSGTSKQQSCSCKFRRVPPKGGDANHNRYAASLQGGVSMDLLVDPQDGSPTVTYDAGTPYDKPIAVYEAKTGHEFMNGGKVNPKVIEDRGAQFAREATVANKCNVSFIIAVDNSAGRMGLKRYFPTYDIRYIPFNP